MRNSCSKCQAICPANALKIDDEISIDERYCVKCGACATVCDNGVFRLLEISDEGIVSKIHEMSSTFDKISFECDGCFNKFRIKHKKLPKDIGKISLPCLGRINEIILLGVHDLGFKEVRFSDCEDKCPMKSARSGLDKSQILATHLIKSLEISTFENNGTNKETFLQSSDEDLINKRREFLFEAGKRAARIAMNKKDAEKKIKGFQDSRINLRRETLLSYLKTHKLVDYSIEIKEIPFSEIDVNDTCDLCGICCRICPTGTLWLENDKKASSLKFDISRCVGCGICQRICNKSSLKIKAEVNFINLKRGPITLRIMPLTVCGKCKANFISIEEAILCQNCTKTSNLISNFLRK